MKHLEQGMQYPKILHNNTQLIIREMCNAIYLMMSVYMNTGCILSFSLRSATKYWNLKDGIPKNNPKFQTLKTDCHHHFNARAISVIF